MKRLLERIDEFNTSIVSDPHNEKRKNYNLIIMATKSSDLLLQFYIFSVELINFSENSKLKNSLIKICYDLNTTLIFCKQIHEKQLLKYPIFNWHIEKLSDVLTDVFIHLNQQFR